MDSRLLQLCGLAAAFCAVTGCAARNQFGRELHLEQHSYQFRGEALGFMAGIPADAPRDTPILVVLEGDGSSCQGYRESRWRRFVTRYTGSYVLIRPRTFLNTVCETPRFHEADFLHRVEETAALIEEVRQEYPGRQVYLLGHSAGAHIALLYSGAHGGAIAGIVNAAGGTWSLSELLPEIAHEKHRRSMIDADRLAEELAALDSLIERVRSSPESSEPMWGRTVRFWNQMFFSGVRPLWTATPLPVLVLHGTEDLESVPISSVQQARNELARAGRSNPEFVLLDGEGHDLLNAKAFAIIDGWIHRQHSSRTTASP